VIRALSILALLARAAHADPATVAVFAPSAPFAATAQRVELATRLADHLAPALGGSATGRVYARATDFAAAVTRGEIAVALVDASYLAATSGYTVLATSLRGGEPATAWQLVARGAARIVDLRGKRVAVPSSGGRDHQFVYGVLLGGELARDHFAKLELAPDTAAALGGLALGKVDAAFVPTGAALPAGVTVVLALPAIANPTLVAYGPAAARAQALVAGRSSPRRLSTTATTASSPASGRPTARRCARSPPGSSRRRSARRCRRRRRASWCKTCSKAAPSRSRAPHRQRSRADARRWLRKHRDVTRTR
jgi:hypothetical protein